MQLGQTFGIDNAEVGTYDPSTDPPDAPVITGVTAGDGQLTVALTTTSPTDVAQLFFRDAGISAWTENETFKRTGSGNIIITGLTNVSSYAIVPMTQNGNSYSVVGSNFYGVPYSTGGVAPLSVDAKNILVANGVGAFAGTADWAIYVNTLPNKPNLCIGINDSPGILQERGVGTGTQLERQEFQILVRGLVYANTLDKIAAIKTIFEALTSYTGVSRNYRSFNRQQVINYLGPDTQQRFMFSLNYQVVVDTP